MISSGVSAVTLSQPGWRFWIETHSNSLWFIALNSHIVIKMEDDLLTAVDEEEETWSSRRQRRRLKLRWCCYVYIYGVGSAQEHSPWRQAAWAWAPASLIACVMFITSITLLGFSLPICKIEKKKNAYFTGLLWELKEVIHEKCSAFGTRHILCAQEVTSFQHAALLLQEAVEASAPPILPAPQESLGAPSPLSSHTLFRYPSGSDFIVFHWSFFLTGCYHLLWIMIYVHSREHMVGVQCIFIQWVIIRLFPFSSSRWWLTTMSQSLPVLVFIIFPTGEWMLLRVYRGSYSFSIPYIA